MDVNRDLIGKTITGIIASVPDPQAPREIWLLQFSDGTHVEFVSPSARASLKRGARRRSQMPARRVERPGQLMLNVT